MYPIDLNNALLARALADSGVGGLTTLVANAAIVLHRLPSSTALPTVVIEIQDAEDASAFGTDCVKVPIRIHTVCAMVTDNASGYAPFAAARAIVARIMGDWNVQHYPPAPTYGFNRWAPGSLGSSGWTASAFTFTGENSDHDESTVHYISSFFTHVSKVAT